MNLKIYPDPEQNDFDCLICCNESCTPPTEYNCTQCDKKICYDSIIGFSIIIISMY